MDARVAVLESRVSDHDATLERYDTRLTAVEKQAAATDAVIRTTGRNVVLFVTLSLTAIGLLFKWFA